MKVGYIVLWDSNFSFGTFEFDDILIFQIVFLPFRNLSAKHVTRIVCSDGVLL